jgi:AraC family transcriptional regulator of arabinose operon
MPLRPETVRPQVSHLVTGHFHEGPGYGAWRSHGTSDWLLIYTVAGQGHFGYRGGEIVAQADDLMLYAPGTPHDYGIQDGASTWDLVWTHFHPRPHWHELIAWPEAAPGLHHIHLGTSSARSEIKALFLETHRLASGGLRRRELFAMNALERLLLACDMHNPRSEHAQLDPRVRRTIEHICSNLAAPHRLSHLATSCGLSISRLAHLFREQVGQSPQQFIEAQRINRAKELLALTGRTIQTIAYDVGFANPFYFTLRFRKHVNQSPRQYRQSQK